MSSPHNEQLRHRADRHLRLATNLTGEAEDIVLRKFVGQRVLLTGDANRIATATGRMMLLTVANLVARFCPRIDLDVPAGSIDEALQLLRALDSSVHAEFRSVSEPVIESYAAVVSIGKPPCDGPRVTAIDARGWLAAVSGAGLLPDLADSTDDNPFGALMAAALGAAEVFKYLLDVRPEKGSHFEAGTFSAYDYSVNGRDCGPSLPTVVEIPWSLLAGIGAVGNALLLTLSYVPGIGGTLAVVDNESLDDDSNLNRYVLALESDADPARATRKTDLAARLFSGRALRIAPFPEGLETFLERIYRGEVPRPRVVLSAVDKNEIRGPLQKLWPGLLIEGATGGTVSQVSRHAYGDDLACLMCIHTVEPRAVVAYEDHAAERAGLTRERVQAAARDASVVIIQEDVDRAPEAKRMELARHVGRPVCSVLAELEQLSPLTVAELPVHPAVSFVSMIAGILAAAELVKSAAGLGSSLETFFQLDSMFPLSNAFLQGVERVETCYCVRRREEIRRYRQSLGEAD